ncbi:MAG TPA: ATPase, T2SS/T4P/T4SS family [Planctomycetota bacterium]|nr:ATPase, T2SS/T4P/T4SS family [Planctomycetota bacterium]
MKRAKTILLTAAALGVLALAARAADTDFAEYRDFEFPRPKVIDKPADVGWLRTTIDLWWLAGMVVVGGGVLWVARWINDDAHKVALNPVGWNLATIATALATLVAFVLIPPFISLPAALAAVVVVLWRYIPLRNRLVLPTRRLFTPAHRRVLWKRFLGLFGMKPPGIEEKLAKIAKKHLPVALFFQAGAAASPAEAPPDERDPATAVKEVVAEAVERHAREVYLLRKPAHLAVAFKIDGLVHWGHPLERLPGAALLQMVKHLADLGSDDPHFRVHVPTMRRHLRFGVTVYGEAESEEVRLVVRSDDEKPRRLDALGLAPDQAVVLREAADRGQGLIVAASPPEMGARTTICAMLDALDPFSRSIVTFERPVAGHLSGIEQNDLTGSEQPLAAILKERIRGDYDLLMVSEIPDKATALMVLTGAQRDQLFIARSEAPDVLSVVTELTALGVPPDVTAKGLHTIAAQRLVRVLCPKCRVRVTPSGELLHKIGLDPSHVQFLWEESSGCEACGHTGFNGRRGIFEIWRIGGKSRDLIAKGAGADALHEAARADGWFSLQHLGLLAVVEGVTSLKELARVLKTGT